LPVRLAEVSKSIGRPDRGSPLEQYDFIAAFEHAPPGVWPAKADDLFEQLADEYRGYAPNVFAWAVLDVIPDIAEIVREIREADRTGKHFMHYQPQQARYYWTHPPLRPILLLPNAFRGSAILNTPEARAALITKRRLKPVTRLA
jgi:hypothetical protein